ncbi:MAG: hypothetical protein K2P21_00895 [Lachnospiraceae bacterium]|nr:hypothetical protein [Lachnospiraceae bacterium]
MQGEELAASDLALLEEMLPVREDFSRSEERMMENVIAEAADGRKDEGFLGKSKWSRGVSNLARRHQDGNV